MSRSEKKTQLDVIRASEQVNEKFRPYFSALYLRELPSAGATRSAHFLCGTWSAKPKISAVLSYLTPIFEQTIARADHQIIRLHPTATEDADPYIGAMCFPLIRGPYIAAVFVYQCESEADAQQKWVAMATEFAANLSPNHPKKPERETGTGR